MQSACPLGNVCKPSTSAGLRCVGCGPFAPPKVLGAPKVLGVPKALQACLLCSAPICRAPPVFPRAVCATACRLRFRAPLALLRFRAPAALLRPTCASACRLRFCALPEYRRAGCASSTARGSYFRVLVALQCAGCASKDALKTLESRA